MKYHRIITYANMIFIRFLIFFFLRIEAQNKIIDNKGGTYCVGLHIFLELLIVNPLIVNYY